MPSRGRRALRKVRALGLGAALLPAGLAACTARPSSDIDASRAAQQISTELSTRYHPASVEVSCPHGVADRIGTSFDCTAAVDGQPVTFRAVVTGGSGRLAITPAKAILDTSTVAARVASEIGTQTGRTPSVTCPPPAVAVVAVGGTLACSATFGSEPSRAVTVTVRDVNGDFGFQLAASASP